MAVDVANMTEDLGSKLQWVELKERRGGIRQKQETGTRNWRSFGPFILAMQPFFLKLCSWQAQSRRIAMAFLCNNQIIAARGNLFKNHSSKQGDLIQTVPCVHATGDAAGAGSWACGQKVCSHPYRMSHFIENNQSGRNNFPSFIRKFLLQYLAPFQFLACQAILLTIHLPPWSTCVCHILLS